MFVALGLLHGEMVKGGKVSHTRRRSGSCLVVRNWRWGELDAIDWGALAIHIGKTVRLMNVTEQLSL